MIPAPQTSGAVPGGARGVGKAQGSPDIGWREQSTQEALTLTPVASLWSPRPPASPMIHWKDAQNPPERSRSGKGAATGRGAEQKLRTHCAREASLSTRVESVRCALPASNVVGIHGARGRGALS